MQGDSLHQFVWGLGENHWSHAYRPVNYKWDQQVTL